ncbi:MAG: sensor histidine kinase [Leptothrix ochracea]|uniref:sensor histidine kinase n=2 Tax=Leptothrix ochracea TaxID=735331 RepID=UPI0034E2477B
MAHHVQRSLFGEILDWMLAPLLLLWPMSLALTWLVAQGIANRPYDRALTESVRVLAQRLELHDDHVRFDVTQETAPLLRADDIDSIYYQVMDAQGQWIGGDRELPRPPQSDEQALGEARLRDDEVHNESVRIASQWVLIAEAQHPVLVQVAETLNKRSRLATEIIKGVILPQFVILPIAVLLVWMALVRGLVPLNTLHRRIRERDSDDLSPIDDREVPEEVSPLVKAINELLARQHGFLQTQKRFLADAAHQLKTPLAGLRMQAELAVRDIDAGQRDPLQLKASLDQMADASQRAAHMVNQLLSMARADAKAQDPVRQRVDLEQVALDVVRDFVPKALDKGIDLGYEGPTEDTPTFPCGQACVYGHPLLLREMIANLVDNALQYTPARGAVTVRIHPDAAGDAVILQVEDSGPGIPAAERDLVFQPFYRALGTAVEGSGLGLAIVAEIARQHEGTITLDDARTADQIPAGEGPGVRITVCIKALPPENIGATPAPNTP